MKTNIKNLFLLPALIAGLGWLLRGAIVASLFALVDSSHAQGTSATLLTTFTNPAPSVSDNLGTSVAAVGSDRVLIGAEGAGAAYLFSLNGTLLTTFTNPTPTESYGFGFSVAGVGSDRMLIGAYNHFTGATQIGAAYLFSTNGTLVTSFTNPAPATTQAFGWSVAAVGSDHVLISGLPDLNKPAPYPGTVYLFRTNGALLTSFTNPIAASAGGFGVSVAVVGRDGVLIGVPYDSTGASQAGVAYLFSTNGTLLTTFTNPVPVADDNFGIIVAAVGSDRVLIKGRAAHLFSTNGTLITTFTNPTPASSVAAVGSSRVIVGAAGAAYLFSTNGTLLTTFTNPTPAVSDAFGYSVTAVGTDQVIISDAFDDTGAVNAGAAFLYAIPYPPLSIARNAATVSLGWVAPETGLILQQASVLNASTVWSNTSDSVSINGLTNVVQQTINQNTNRFFRLHRP